MKKINSLLLIILYREPELRVLRISKRRDSLNCNEETRRDEKKKENR